MKKLLFITYAFDKNTPVGVGAQRIVTSLSNHGYRVFVITSQTNNIVIPNVDVLAVSNHPRIPAGISNKLSNLFGRELLYLSWEIRACVAGNKILRNNHDVIAIYTRANPISVCPVGARLSSKYKIPLLMHFTDPIPAPEEWYPDPSNRKRMIKQMRSLLSYPDLISFGNKHMLLYEEKCLGVSLQQKAFVSPDPGFHDFVYLPPKDNFRETINLLFLGNIYGNRNPLPLFEAIKQLSRYPIKLYLYGNNQANYPDFVIKRDRTDDVRSVMQNMDVLIDIDGDDNIPVFVSSKLKDYLSVNRPILAITPENSPSREILSNLSTVGISINETQHIKDTMLKLINIKHLESDYEERIPVLKLFDPEQIASKIINQIHSLNIRK